MFSQIFMEPKHCRIPSNMNNKKRNLHSKELLLPSKAQLTIFPLCPDVLHSGSVPSAPVVKGAPTLEGITDRDTPSLLVSASLSFPQSVNLGEVGTITTRCTVSLGRSCGRTGLLLIALEGSDHPGFQFTQHPALCTLHCPSHLQSA